MALNLVLRIFVIVSSLLTATTEPASESVAYERIMRGIELQKTDEPLWVGAAHILRCSGKCYSLSCKLWIWDSSNSACKLYASSNVDGTSSVPTTTQENYLTAIFSKTKYSGLLGGGNWTDAKATCESRGMRLAFVRDLDWLRSYMKSMGVTGFYTGVQRLDPNSTLWHDLAGNDVTSEMSWSPTEPSMESTQLCTGFFGGGLNDLRCDTSRPIAAICESLS